MSAAPAAGAHAGLSPGVERLKRIAEELFGAPVTDALPLAGDASDRRYLRLRHPEGDPPTSVGMILAAPFAGEELPFLSVQRHFAEIGQPVPRVYAADAGAGVLLLEDGGPRSLEDVVNAGGWEAAWPFYEGAVDLIASLQDAPPGRGRLALGRAFDEALFARELHHARRYALEGLAGAEAPEAAFAEDFARLAAALCRLPYRLTHRDFHSRNLLAGEGGRLTVLDFQDARLGPLTYDLVSLTFDSYVVLPGETRELLHRRFRAASGEQAVVADPDAFAEALALTGLQRNLKAIGTFAFQRIERGTPRYLRHIPPTVASVRAHLGRLPGWAGLAERLAPHLGALEAIAGEAAG